MRAVLAVLVVGLAVGCGKKAEPTTASGASAKPPGISYTPLTADQLIDEWAVNSMVVSEKYRLESIEVRGVLESMNSVGNEVSLRVRGETNTITREVVVIAESTQARDGIKKCVVGKPVVVRGRTDGRVHSKPELIADSVRPG